MFSRRWLINYLLFVLIIIFTWIGMKYPPDREQRQSRDNAITRLAAQDITRMTIETADLTLQLEKSGTRWMLTSPLKWFANNINSERLATLASVEAQSTLPRQDIQLSELGLTIPRAVVTLNQKSIYFGDTNQIGNRRYLLVDPNVYLVSDIHYPFISQQLPAFIDNRLLPAGLDIVSLESKGFTLRKDAGVWTSNNSLHSAEAINRLIHHWQTKASSSIKPYDKALTPLQRVKVSTAESGTLEFYLLSIKPEIILARPDLGVQYHFPDFHYYDLLSPKQADD